MLSLISRYGMPSTWSSQAVSRAPCSHGRVSSTSTEMPPCARVRGADDAERRAVPGRRQGAGVAVREDAVAGLEQRGAVLADAQAAVDVVVVDRLRAGEQRGGERTPARRGSAQRRSQTARISPIAQLQVDGRGPRGQQAARGLLERGPRRRPRSSALAAAASAAASASPPAAVTPIAGAPRTVMSVMRAATSRHVRQCT